MVKIFTMVKDELDIVKDWVLYHGSIFGYKNLYIIDNYSEDGTYDMLIDLKNKYEINVFQYKDYNKKGEYMTDFLKKFCKNEFAFPIDIDEFIVLYNKKSNIISCNSDEIYKHIRSLPKSNAYKMNYIWTKILINNGYDRAATECNFGSYLDYGNFAKTFFYSSLFKGVIDHGNHFRTDNFLLTRICLVHYHCRNLDQMKKKVYNNVLGLGHDPLSLEYLKNIITTNPSCMGHHHITNQINILENKYTTKNESYCENDINLKPISDKLLLIG